MASLAEILKDPNYINANQATKEAIFNKYSGQDKNYTDANEATQAAIRNKFSVGQPQDEQPATSTQEKPKPVAKPAEDDEGFFGAAARGFKSYIPQTKEIIGGGEAILGKALGVEGLKKAGLENIKEAQAAQQEISKDTDSFSVALNEGVGSVITDWLPYQMGAGAANVLESLAAMAVGTGIGAVAGSGVGSAPGAAVGAVTGLVEKQLIKKGIKEAAEKIAQETAKTEGKEAGKQASKAFIEEQAKKEVAELAASGFAKQGAKAYGANVGIGAAAATHGLGEVGSRAVEEAQARGQSLDDVNLSKVLPAATLHATADYVADKIGIGALGKNLSGAGKSILADIAKNIAITGSKEVPPELVQSLMERYGAELPLADKQAFQEYIDTTAASYAMSVGPGVVGGVRSNLAAKQNQTEPTDTTQTTPPTGDTSALSTQDTTKQSTATSSAFNEDELNESETGKTVGVTSQDNDINQIIEGAGHVGANGESIGAGFEIVKSGRGKSTKGAGAANAVGMDGAGSVISSTDAGAQGEQSALNEIEQNVIGKMQESGSDFKDVNHVKNWVKKHIFKGDFEATNQLQQNNPDIFKRLLDEHKLQVAKNQEQKDQYDENHLVDLEETQNIVEKKKKKEPKSKRVDAAQELLSEATETDDPIVRKVKTKKAKEKVEGAKPQEIPGHEYFEEVNEDGTINSGYRAINELTDEEKARLEEISSDPQAQEVLSKILSDPNVPQFKKTLAQKFIHPYLLSKSKDAAHAPKDMDEAIKTAAAEAAMDELSLINLTDRDESLESEAKASNEFRQKEFNEKVQKLVEERGLSVEKARREIGGFKQTKYSKKHIIAHKGEDAFHEFSKQFVDEEEEKAQQEPAKKAEIGLRQDFINSLSKKQKAEFDKLRKNFIAQDHRIRAQRIYTRGTTTGLQTTKKTKDKKREPNKLGLEGLSEFVLKNPDIKWMDKPTTEKTTPVEGPEALKDDDYFKTYMAKVKRHITKQKKLAQDKKSKKEQAKYADELEESKTAPLSAKDKLAANIEEAIRAGKTAAEILSIAAGKLQNRMFTSQFISSHYANLLKRIKADVKIVYGVVEDGRPGKFDPATDTITINEEYSGPDTLDETLNHEVTHYLMDHLVDHPSMLSEIQKQALNSLRLQYKQIKTILSKQKFEINGVPVSKLISNLKEFNAMIMGSKEFQIAVGKIEILLKSNLSEQEFNESLAKLLNKIDTTEDTTASEEENIKPIAKEARGSIFSRLSKTIAKMLGFSTLSADIRKELFEAGHSRDEVNRISNRDSGRLLQQVINNIQLMITPKIVNGKPVTEETIDGVTSIVGYQAPSGEFRGKKVSYAPSNKQSKKTPNRPRTVEELEADSTETVRKDLPQKAAFIKDVWGKVVNPRSTYRELVKKFQSATSDLKIWQRTMYLRNRVITDKLLRDADGNSMFNNVYELLTQMFSKADTLFHEEVGESYTELTNQIDELKSLTNLSFEEVMGKLDNYLKAMHEPERRRLLFIKNLELSKTIQIKLPNGFVGTPANIKARIFEALDKPGLSEKQCENLRKLLDNMIFTNKGDLDAILSKDRMGTLNMNIVDTNYYNALDASGKNKAHLLLESDPKYSPVNEMTPIEVDATRGRLNADKVMGPKIKEIFKTLQKIEEKSKTMYKKANYWSPQVSNYVSFYGFKHYVPYKGRPDLAMEKTDNLFYNEKDPLSKRFHEATKGMAGRKTKASNAVSQILVDARKAAFSIYSNEVAEATGNAIRQGWIPTKVKDKKPYKSIKFEDRETDLTDEELGKRDTIFHYRPNGIIDIYTISDPKILESLRAPYKANVGMWNDFVNGLGAATRYLGLNYTLLNVKFAPWNFARDVITNVLNISVDFGLRAMAETVGNTVKIATLDTLCGGGMFKSGKAMHLYQTNQITRIKELAKTDKFYKNFYDLAVKGGGVVTFLQGASSRNEILNLAKQIGQGNAAKTGKFVLSVFQYWFNMFELTSKIGAMGPIKNAISRQYPNMSEAELNEKTAFEVKNLANFEQSGTLGREMGALFMFSRAQSTGAVRALDSLSYVLPVETAMKDLSKAEQNDPQVVAEFKKNYEAKALRARVMTAVLIGAGYAAYSMMLMGADDDDLNDNKISKDDSALWTRAMRFTLPGAENKQVFQLPWGFGLGALQAWGAQMAILVNGNQTYGEFLSNCAQIGIDSFIPLPVSRISFKEHPMEAIADTLTPSLFRPTMEWLMHVDGLGHAINQDNSQSGTPNAFKGRGGTPEYIKDFCLYMFNEHDVDLNPNSVNFWLNSYMSAANQFASTVDNMKLLAEDEKDFDAKTDSVFAGSFIGKLPDREAKEFIRVETEIKKLKQSLKGRETLFTQYTYMDKHPMVYDLIDLYDKDINGGLKNLREEATNIRNAQYTPKYRDDLLSYNNYQQRMLKKALVYKYKLMDSNLKAPTDKD
jgi:hypothetical protein